MQIIKRELYLSQIRKYYDIDLIKVLTGIRRCGKSLILNQIMEELKINNPDARIIYMNFEDFEFEEIDTAKKLHEYIKAQIKNSDKYYLFFDEIQHVKEFERVIASFKATLNCSIFITGSNSKLLSGELATLLVGRTVEFQIMPFSYFEAVQLFEMSKKSVPENFIINYIKWGGMPQRFDFEQESDIQKYLEDVFNGIVEKDIYKRDSDIEKYKFNTISGYILSNAGKEFSAENITNFYNCKNEKNKVGIEKKTIYNYVEKLEKAYLISRVKRFNIVGKEVLKTIEKHYAIDTGFRTINTNLINYEDTFFLENIIYNELILRGFSVYTGKTYKSEIDFVAINGKKKCFIQVSYLMPNESTIKREFEAFEPIKDASPKYVLSLDKIDLSHNGITHINLEDFLLHKKDLFLA